MATTSDQAGPPFVCFAAVDWWYHNRAHSELQLMQRVARERTVLLVNSIGMRMPLPGRSTKAWSRIVRKLKSMAKLVRRPVADLPGFHVMTPLILPFYSLRWARALNARMVRAQVRLVSRFLRIEDPVLVVTIPTAWEVVRPMRRRALVFNRVDKHSTFAETDQDYIRALEEALLRHADRVLYVSHALMEEELPLAGDRAVFLDHGVDLDHFRPRPPEEEPDDLRLVPHPRIGFFGGLDDYVIDFGLLERLAREIPEAQVVLVGDATCSMDRLESLPNVRWLGYRGYEEIPRYGSGFDVAILPRLDDEWSRYTNPIKLKEYLALGLPVVTTAIPEVERHGRWVRIACGPDDFVAQVRAALAGGGPGTMTPEERREAVLGDSWDRRAEELLGHCDRAGDR
ncbi:MAG: glycosyltransferase [Acidimicrobiia bacterium]|nr:glycosyltransferase [Acidimicrobiia bacterium]